MDKYDATNDHYCYSGTPVLINKLNIRDGALLELAERDITNLTINNVLYQDPPYNLDYFKKIHRALFSELYEWAGDIRTVDISKGGTRFCNCNRVVPESEKLFKLLAEENWLENLTKNELSSKLAEYYCEFNMIHPFREGNGRVQRIFFEHLVLYVGYELDWSDITPREWVDANIDGVSVIYSPMDAIFRRTLR